MLYKLNALANYLTFGGIVLCDIRLLNSIYLKLNGVRK